MNNVVGQIEQAEIGNTGEIGNFSYNDDVLDAASVSAADHSNWHSSGLVNMVCSSNLEGTE